MSDRNTLIAIDADGVLVNYHAGYAKAWKRAFAETLETIDPDGYTTRDRFGVRRLDKAGRDELRAAMDETFWSALPAIDGALEACTTLHNAGYRLVCVSAVKEKYRDARAQNLRDLGFPLEAVYAAPKDGIVTESPKAAILEELKPIAFVDDFAPYLRGVSDDIHKALLLRHPNGSPNTGDALKLATTTHKNLLEFSNWWLENNR